MRFRANWEGSAGGPKAWKEMRQRQMEFYQSFDFEPQNIRDADECLQEEVEGTEENGERVLDAEDHEEGEESDTVSMTISALVLNPSTDMV